MNIVEFLTIHPVVSEDVTQTVSDIMKFSRKKSRALIEWGAVDVYRNDAVFKVGRDSFLLKDDVIRIGKGHFFKMRDDGSASITYIQTYNPKR